MKFFARLFSLVAVLTLVGCGTVQGLGQDIQRGGQIIEDAARN